MKLKINKACDLSSISVLPPQSRRSNPVPPTGPQASQLRSQPSQQSFSQGLSSQHGILSQPSQNSLDDVLTNDQRYGSQERDSVKKSSSLPPISYTREESQMQIARSSTSIIRKWNPSSVQDHRCKGLINEELGHRIVMLETSCNRFGMILDSVQSDVMQINKGTKEALLEMEGIRQKLIVQDNSLHVLNKGQEDIKARLDGGLKSIYDQLSKNMYQEKLQEIFSVLSALPGQIDASVLKLRTELCRTFTEDLQAIACSLKAPKQKCPAPVVLSPKCTGCCGAPQRKPQPLKNPAVPPKVCAPATLVPKIEMGRWNSVKVEQATSTNRASKEEQKRTRVSSIGQDRECRVAIDSDEEIDGGFSCLLEEKETGMGSYLIEEAKEETVRILRKARRRKRKYSNSIIIT